LDFPTDEHDRDLGIANDLDSPDSDFLDLSPLKIERLKLNNQETDTKRKTEAEKDRNQHKKNDRKRFL
jgi:hypothetical protein